jgi:hypothetical protein
VIATHGRGIWIVDDLTPLRALAKGTLEREVAFLPARPLQQLMPASGGWAEGDATFVGQNAPSGAVITYYQRSRHLFGPLKLEVLDAEGKVIDTIPASKRRGINRAVWSMQVKPPRVPRAATLAGAAAQGPRVVPGTYTVRLSKGASEPLLAKLDVHLDRRAPYTVADRREQFDAAMRVHALFGQMSALVDRIELARTEALQRAKSLGGDALAARVQKLAADLDEVRKKIVATKEGGAITGEERLREHTDLLYGALLSWEGRPARYLVERIEVLQRELGDVEKDFDQLVSREARALDGPLKEKGLSPIPTAFLKGGRPERAASAAELAQAMRCASDESACDAERATR